ncbi:MAG: phosphoribosylglycinamide formyltransferase [Croceitalea sp.]|nr:phosphoribosylglycinamide formyltransferase [Croceitalea sp.]NNL08186.1 phosphoribosylglycinamide formyltransferase [Croceitalea sp.]NNM17017.1 phosphoribosylglycinamide formyltransferase [Croceitalea sp.]
MKKIVIFASGAGSNAENIIKYFENNANVEVSAVLTNKSDAGVLKRCAFLKKPALYFNRMAFEDGVVAGVVNSLKPDLIVLAGFLWKIPKDFIKDFKNKIINIHPALLPKYGGKGMYGVKVHEAVKNNFEKVTGITIHYVNENYDEGAIIHQAKVSLSKNDSIHDIANKVHALEYEHFPKVIEKILLGHG